MSDFRLTGADDFLKLSKALKAAGEAELRKELNKRLKGAVKPLTPETRAQARATLPKRGGLAAQVAKEPQRVQVRTGKDPGIALVVGRKRGAARSTNQGTVRHPTPNGGGYVDQAVTPGWFDKPTERAKPQVTKAVEQAMQSVVDDIVRGAR